MSPDDPRHGLARGYYAHRKAGQTPCHACTRAASEAKRVKFTEDNIALIDGEWRGVGGIMRWFPALTSAPTPPPFNPDELACERCGATITQACRTKTGGTSASHAYRAPRRCPCGAGLGPRKSICGDCARENELSAKRRASRLWYESRRGAA